MHFYAQRVYDSVPDPVLALQENISHTPTSQEPAVTRQKVLLRAVLVRGVMMIREGFLRSQTLKDNRESLVDWGTLRDRDQSISSLCSLSLAPDRQ